jgi:hypothetical protein
MQLRRAVESDEAPAPYTQTQKESDSRFDSRVKLNQPLSKAFTVTEGNGNSPILASRILTLLFGFP